MQAQGQPNFAGVDFNQYQGWQRVTTPSGGVYYAVPGTSYVYDPFLSAARGQPVLWANPTQRDQEIQRQRDVQEEQRRQAERASSPEGQLLPIAGTVGGTVGSAYLINSMRDTGVPEAVAQSTAPSAGGALSNPGVVSTPTPPAAVQAPGTSGEAFVQGAMGPEAAAPMTPANAGPVAQTTVVPAGQAVPEGMVGVGTTADGGTLAVSADSVQSDGSINFGAAAQGVLGGVQMFQGFRALQGGDYLGGGLGMTTGAANVGAALGSEFAAGYVPGLNIATGLYTGYRTFDSMGDMANGGRRNAMGAAGGASAGASIGAGIGSIVPGVGTAIGAGIGAVIGGLSGLAAGHFGSSKDKYQMIRDEGRKFLQQNGILDENYQGTLADGSTFDFGKDGKKYGKPQFDNPLYGEAAAYGNVLATIEGLYGRSREAMAMLYGNAGVSNASDNPNVVLDNFRHFAQQRGITLEAASSQINKMHDEGNITEHQRDVFLADARKFIPAGGESFGKPQGVTPPPVSQQPALQGQVVSKPAPLDLQRSQTLSPGIDLQGNRIAMGKELARRMDRRL